ncbi:MAG: hypothetical protein HY360_01000 [Verrucomicrobia bacterium]|nr:hypothetical protein [Verrucomicrobiota bacterium]
MRVLVTGMIAGLDDREYLDKVIKLCASKGLTSPVYHLLDMVTGDGKKPLEKMLGTTDYVFELTREREWVRIGYEIEKSHLEHVVVRAPATIEWNRINRKCKDAKYIQQYVRPDLIVTLIDAEWLIQERLEKPPKNDPFLRAIKQKNHTIYEILSWMNEEVSLSEDWAKMMGIRHIVLATKQPPESLYQFIRHPNVHTFYASYSMTHADPAIRKQVDAVIKRLATYGVVIDPQTIEIGTHFDNFRDKEAIYAFTVHRDLHWFVGKTDSTVAIHPYLERPPLSTGMMDELGHARDYHKNRYMIFPKGISPFTSDSYIEKGRLFEDENQFFEHLEKVEGFKPLD